MDIKLSRVLNIQSSHKLKAKLFSCQVVFAVMKTLKIITGTEETPSSMVSSEAESEGSIVSEQRPPDGEPALTNDNSITDTNTLQDKSVPTLTAGDWRNVGNTLASIVSTRGLFYILFGVPLFFHCLQRSSNSKCLVFSYFLSFLIPQY